MYKMESDLPITIERELTPLERGLSTMLSGVSKVGEGVYTLDKSKFDRIDTLVSYESRNKTSEIVCSVAEAKELRGHLNWFFKRGGFNALHLHLNNPSLSPHILAGIKSQEDLDYYMDIVEKEIGEGRYPVKYSILRAFSISKTVKWRSLK